MTARSRIAASGFDKTSAAIAVVITLLLARAAWLRFGPPPAPETPRIGAPAPALRLLDPTTSEPLVLPGLNGKVVWIGFVSHRAADLTALETVWKRFKARPRFAMAALSVENDRPDRHRADLAIKHSTLPTYIASPETCRAFGVDPIRLPLHVLIDPTGHVAAVAEGRGEATLARLVEQTERALDEFEPMGKTRFAGRIRGVVAVKSLAKSGRAG